MFPTVDPSLPPAHLRSLLPMQQTPWMVSSTLFKRLQQDPTKNPHFDPQWGMDSHLSFRKKVINRWKTLTDPYSPCTLPNKRQDVISIAKVIPPQTMPHLEPLWHGTKSSICESIDFC